MQRHVFAGLGRRLVVQSRKLGKSANGSKFGNLSAVLRNGSTLGNAQQSRTFISTARLFKRSTDQGSSKSEQSAPRFKFGKTAIVIGTSGVVALSAIQTIQMLKLGDEEKAAGQSAKKRSMQAHSANDGSQDFFTAVIRKYTIPVIAITAINTGVFLAWRMIPRLHNFFFKHFMCSYHGVFHERRFHTLLTSVFSHHGGYHFLFNVLAFSSVAPILCKMMGDSQFWQFYLGTGILSSITGLLAAVTFTQPGLRAEAMVRPSLGASGSVCGLFAITALLFPDTRFQIIFLPFFNFSAQTMMYGLIAFDLGGLAYSVIRGLSPLGHGAHLGGVLCGYLYYEYYLKKRNPRIRRVLEIQGRLK